MRSASVTSQSGRSSLLRAGMVALLALATACVPASSPSAPTAARTESLPKGAFYLRTVDGRTLPVSVGGGAQIESGFVVADTVTEGLVGFGESVVRDRSSAVRLASGSARVVGEDSRNARIAQVTWQADGSAAADSVSWSADSLIVYRTGVAPSAAGAGHRLIYTRTIPSDTL